MASHRELEVALFDGFLSLRSQRGPFPVAVGA